MLKMIYAQNIKSHIEDLLAYPRDAPVSTTPFTYPQAGTFQRELRGGRGGREVTRRVPRHKAASGAQRMERLAQVV